MFAAVAPRRGELLVVATIGRVADRVRGLGHQPRRDLRLLGEWRWNSKYPAEKAEWDAGTLYLGCRDCLDASPDYLRIEAVTATGFWGTWINHQSGIAHVVDDKGKPLPDPAGYFCAARLGET